MPVKKKIDKKFMSENRIVVFIGFILVRKCCLGLNKKKSILYLNCLKTNKEHVF